MRQEICKQQSEIKMRHKRKIEVCKQQSEIEMRHRVCKQQSEIEMRHLGNMQAAKRD